MTNRVWSKGAASQLSLLLSSAPHVTIWSNGKACIWAAEAPNGPAVSEGVLVSSQDNQYTLSRSFSPCLSTFTCVLSTFTPRLCNPHPTPPFRSLAEPRTGLHFPGHLGWWSPLPQGLGRPPGLLLEENTRKQYAEKKSEIVCIIKLKSGLAFLTAGNISAERKK